MLLKIIGIYKGSQMTIAIKICKIYKHLKQNQTQHDEVDLLKNTARKYFQSVRWDTSTINMTINSIFENKSNTKQIDLKSLISTILYYENPNDFKSDIKALDRLSKRITIIDNAVNKVLGN